MERIVARRFKDLDDEKFGDITVAVIYRDSILDASNMNLGFGWKPKLMEFVVEREYPKYSQIEPHVEIVVRSRGNTRLDITSEMEEVLWDALNGRWIMGVKGIRSMGKCRKYNADIPLILAKDIFEGIRYILEEAKIR